MKFFEILGFNQPNWETPVYVKMNKRKREENVRGKGPPGRINRRKQKTNTQKIVFDRKTLTMKK